MARSEIKQVAGDAEHSAILRVPARVGFVVLGVMHILIGAIAISIAVGAGHAEADQSGAMSQLSHSPAGEAALWAIGAGLFALAAWQIVQAILVPAPDPAKRWGKRVVDLAKALTYVVFGITAVVFAVGGHKSTSGATKSLSASLIASPGGVYVVAAIGLTTIGVAVGFGVRGVTRSFRRRLSLPRAPWGSAIVALGSTGYLAKAVALAIVGVLFVVAAVTLNPKAASGLDGALKALMRLPYGEVVLWIVGAGLIAYGVFCMARAAFERL
ncbi:MAG TPA: DUF1206 domain-containing protein [Humibacter sp.]|nr:DUF1206 domain-containing protein [Humibacter sp.]